MLAEIAESIREDLFPVLIGLVLVGAYAYMSVNGQPINPRFEVLVEIIVAVYFGKQLHATGVANGERRIVQSLKTAEELTTSH
jgi:hypothetical protein